MTQAATEPEADTSNKTYSFTWRVSDRMLESLREWAEENYDDWAHDKRHFKTNAALVRQFMQDAVWQAFSGWKREAEEQAQEEERTERIEKILKYHAPFESARDALEALLEEPTSVTHGRLQVALQAVVDLEDQREKEREEREAAEEEARYQAEAQVAKPRRTRRKTTV